MKFTNNLTKGNIGEQILKFSTPFVIGNFCMQLYNYVDAIIVGQFLGKDALAAVGSTSPIIFVLLSFVSGITIGGSIIVAKYFVANDNDKLSLAANTINYIVLGIGLFVTVLGYLFADEVIGLMSLPTKVSEIAVSYLRIFMIGLLPTFCFNSTMAILRGMGNSITPLYFLVITAILNIILDVAFVVVLGWGIESVAWATVISQYIAFFLLWMFTFCEIKHISFDLTKFNFDKDVAKETIKLGVPTAVQQLLVSAGTVVLISIVIQFGTDVIAAYTSAQRVLILIMVLPINLSLALTTFVAQNYAVKSYDRVIAGFKSAMKISLIACFAILILLSMFSASIIQMFTSDINIINIGKQYIMIIALGFWLFNIMMLFSGLIRGLGNTVVPMLITLFSLWLVKIPLAKLLSFKYNEVGVWFSEPISWAIGILLSMLYLYYKRKGLMK